MTSGSVYAKELLLFLFPMVVVMRNHDDGMILHVYVFFDWIVFAPKYRICLHNEHTLQHWQLKLDLFLSPCNERIISFARERPLQYFSFRKPAARVYGYST